MHPQQHPLPPEIDEIWLAALEDAHLSANECLLYLFDGSKSETGYAGWHFQRGRHIYESENLGAQVNALLPTINADECIDAVRILAWRERTTEGLAAAIRHELHHAVQTDAHGGVVEELHHVAIGVIAVRVGGLPGGSFMYQAIPDELDANAAAARFVWARYGEPCIRELLEARDEDSASFRSLVGPAPTEALLDRFLAFFVVHSDLCQMYAETQELAFSELLNLHWNGGGTLWQQLVEGGLIVGA